VKAIVQARLTSTRFPGKVLQIINGKTMLSNVIERLQQCKNIDDIIIAIPFGPSQRELLNFKKFYNVKIFDACPENDVAGRFGAVCDFYGIKDFVRVCADSPFIQPWVIDYAIEQYKKIRPDYLVTEGMPDGMNAEVVEYNALKKYYPKMTNEEKEHVTLYFENHDVNCFKLDLKHMSVDTISDLIRLEEISKYAI